MRTNCLKGVRGVIAGLLALALQAGALEAKAGPEPGFAPYGGGVQLREENWPAPPPFITKFRHDTEIKFWLDKTWNENTTTSCDSIRDTVGKPGAVGGQTLYDISCSMSTSGQQLAIKDKFASDAFEPTFVFARCR